LFGILVAYELISQLGEQLAVRPRRSGVELAEALLDSGVILSDQ
jgi:hypothetical protein